MHKIPTRQLGKTEAQLTQFGLGCAPLGDLFVAISEDQAQQTLQAAWDAGVRYFDTAPFYGYGKSEHRVGHFLRQQAREDFVISTKVGRTFHAPHNLAAFDKGDWQGGLPFEFTVDFSYDGIMRSFEDSLLRLSLPSVDLLVIHDLDIYFHQTKARVNAYLNQLFTSGWRALDELRRHGLIKGVGAGINETGMIPRFLDLVELDFFLVAYGYNLLTQEMLEAE
ncbi:MAG: aldo/keto reductase, partial [Chloroflexota bacterium]